MKNKNKLDIVRFLVTIGLLSILISIWQCLEASLYGEIQHRVVDDIINHSYYDFNIFKRKTLD